MLRRVCVVCSCVFNMCRVITLLLRNRQWIICEDLQQFFRVACVMPDQGIARGRADALFGSTEGHPNRLIGSELREAGLAWSGFVVALGFVEEGVDLAFGGV